MNTFLTLCWYEWKKLWGRKSIIFFLVIASIFMVAMILLPYIGNGYEYRYYAEDGSVERISAPYLEIEKERKDYLLAYSGQILDDSLMQQLSRNYMDSALGTSQWNLNEYAPFRYLNTLEVHSAASADEFYDTSGFLQMLRQNHVSEGELSYWKQELDNRELIFLDYCGGWIALIKNTGLLSMLTMLIVGIGLCPVFSDEHKVHTDQLILSSQNGRRLLFFAKLLAGVSCAILIPIIFYFEQLVTCGAVFGLRGFSAPLRLWVDGGNLWNFSVGQYSLLMLALLLIASIMLAALVLLVSEASRNGVPALIVSFTLVAVPLLGFYSPVGNFAERVFNYIPTIRVSIATLEDYYLVHIGNTYFNCIQFSSILYSSLSVILLLLCWQFYRCYQIVGR